MCKSEPLKFMIYLFLNFEYCFFLISGHYVPQLAQLMTQFNKKEKLFNLRGIAVNISNLSHKFQDFHASLAITYS